LVLVVLVLLLVLLQEIQQLLDQLQFKVVEVEEEISQQLLQEIQVDLVVEVVLPPPAVPHLEVKVLIRDHQIHLHLGRVILEVLDTTLRLYTFMVVAAAELLRQEKMHLRRAFR